MNSDRPTRSCPISLAVALFVSLFVLTGRMSLTEEGAPAFFVPAEPEQWVELGTGCSTQGVCQIIDNMSPKDVMALTDDASMLAQPSLDTEWERPLLPDERLELTTKGCETAVLKRTWMTAHVRLTLGIPLHPDRMNWADWQTLPGIGEKLATRIEAYRQKNGDFGRLDALRAVPGIGPKRIAAWREYF